MKDYHAVLGVPRDADEKAIRRAYRRLAMQYHPDRNKDAGAPEKFKEISEAYAVLSGKEKPPETGGREPDAGGRMRPVEAWGRRVAGIWEEMALRRHDNAYR